MRTVVNWYRPLVQARTWKETAALLVCLPLGIAWFTVLVTGLSVSAGLLITLIGIPLLVLTVAFGRVIGIVERAKARALLDADLPAFPKQRRRPDESWWKWALRRAGDGPSWRGVAYGFISFPLGHPLVHAHRDAVVGDARRGDVVHLSCGSPATARSGSTTATCSRGGVGWAWRSATRSSACSCWRSRRGSSACSPPAERGHHPGSALAEPGVSCSPSGSRS